MQERSRYFPGARRPSARRPRASRATCAPPARPLVHSASTPSALVRALLNHVFLVRASRQLSTHVLSYVRLTLSSQERFSHTELSYAQPHSTVPRPLLCPHSSPKSTLATSPPSFGRVESAPPFARTRHPSPLRFSLQRQADDEDAHLLLPCETGDDEMRFYSLGDSGGTSRRATPRLHPSLGECHHTVRV